MKIDATEVQRIIEASKSGRLDLDTTAHNAMRSWLSSVIVNVGQMNANDDAHCQDVLSQVSDFLSVLQGHTLPPERMAAMLLWVNPSVSSVERAQMLQDMRADSHLPAFKGVLEIASSCLPTREWLNLFAMFHLPPVHVPRLR